MKLIVCLLILSLICAFWSSGFIGSTVGEAPKGDIVLEQPFAKLRTLLQRDPSPMPWWWRWDMWAEWLTPCRRRGRRWRKLYRLLRRLKRWYEGVRRWCLLQQEGQALMEGTSPKEPSTEGTSFSPLETEAAAPRSNQQSPSPVASSTVEEAPPPTQQGPGRPRTIPTHHVCCPNEPCPSYGILGPHPDHNIVGCGTYTAHGEKRQMYRCLVCGKRFSETVGTPFFGLKTPMRTVCIALNELAEGLGVRAVARIHHVKPDTVLDWLRKAGQHCEAVSAYMMQELELSQVQLDELWTFIRKKERMLSEWEKLQTEYGDNWIWMAFDPIHKLVVAVLIGDHTEKEAVGLLTRLHARLMEACLPLLTSDALPHYAEAILRVFGVWVQPQRKGTRGRFPKPRQVAPEGLNYATVQKEREGGRVVSVTTQVVYGSLKDILACLKPLRQTINTSFVERMNLTLRHLVSRLHRKSLCFSKRRKYLAYHLHLALAYYHFVRYHSSLRVRLPEPIPTRGDGSPKKWKQHTPAMAAGLTDHAWSLEELLMCHVPAAAG
jgi:IS1 family transposase/transposase-like protein